MIKLLHIDDDQIEFEILHINLTNLAKDFEVLWAETGEQAIKMLQDEEFDCVLCDFQMPVMNGFEIIKRVKDENIRVPFIFLTGQGNQEIAVEAFRAGAEDYYTKEEGFAHYDRLISRIRKIVEKEDEIKSSQTILQNAINAIPDLICVYDSESRVVMSNWGERVDGWKVGMSKDDIHELLWGAKCHCEKCIVESVFETGEPQTIKRTMGGGSLGMAKVNIYPVYDSKGQVKYVTEHIRQVTPDKDETGEPVDSQRALLFSEDLLIHGSWYWNINKNEFVMSRKMREIFEFSEGEEFSSLYDVLAHRVHHDDLEICQRSLKGVLKQAFEFRIKTESGNKWVYITPFKVIDKSDAGEPNGLFGAVQDVTERKEFETQLAHSNFHLSVANDELESFAYTVSHDLRTPLRHIRGYLEIFIVDYLETLDETAQSYLKKILASSEAMEHLIEDILQLSRASRMELAKTEVNISEVAESILSELAAQEPERKTDFVIEKDIIQVADRSVVNIVLANLLNNAWKFTKNREVSEITLKREDSSGGFRIMLKDNGTGFNQAYADEMFGAFKRFHKQSEYPGTGIGLATVKRMLDKHGGSISAEGEQGKGATFRFSFNQ